jgi:transcription elongation factor SPT4
MVAPDESWVARYQGITGMIRGCYALRVHGELNEEHIQTLEENGVRYRPLSEAD